jgi:parallel beta-helix repeat protein
MKKTISSLLFFFLVITLFFYNSISAIIGPVIPGQSLWCINQRMASEIDNIESKLDNLCQATMITEPGTIAAEGAYCLGNEIMGAITIAASNVDLDLSNRRITDGIIVNGDLDQISIENGTVEGGSDAISVLPGTHNVTIHDVTVKNGTRGISLQGVTDSVISNCEMTSNATGIELESSRNITIKNCVALSNTFAGYSLISSTTNNLQDCKALSTGEGNAGVTNNNVFGFVANDGSSNIFERCIAGATQALTTTDQNSLVAGFALRGLENCTKIIECEAAKSITSPDGVTVPYGILLESRFDGVTTVTSVNPEDDNEEISSVAWSPDGKYVAITISTTPTTDEPRLFLYKFDRLTQGLVKLVAIDVGISELNAVAWSPDGLYLAVGGDIDNLDDFLIYKFDHIGETLTRVKTVTVGDQVQEVRSINWSFDGRFIALGVTGSDILGIPGVIVLKFDAVTETVTLIAGANPDGGALDDIIFSVEWSPDGKYLAVGGTVNGTTGNDLFIYSFNESLSLPQSALTQVVSVNPDGGATDSITAVTWSPDGNYLAVGGQISGITGNDLFVYRFDRSTNTLTPIASVNPDGGSSAVLALSWSPDGVYLAAGGIFTGTTGNDFFVYRFDRGVGTLTEIDSDAVGGTESTINSISWSPDGGYVAVGGDIAGNDVFVLSALQFPVSNVIKNNTVYCNSGNQYPGGVGISGSSICNYIANNTAYSNPINPPIVGSNYQFVTNVFRQLFGTMPSTLQNVSLTTCEPPCNPVDLELLIKQNLNKTEIIIDSLACGATPITAEDAFGGSVAINESGNYCLATDITADISITATCVSLDLNNRCLTGTIAISQVDDIVVKNGFILPPVPDEAPEAGIMIDALCNNVVIENMIITCANTAISLIDGRSGISTGGNDVQIINCTVKSGNAGDEAVGGDGIIVAEDATRTLIKDCVILATGNGGTGGGAGGGRGGHGISVGLNAIVSLTEIINCIVFSTGNGGTDPVTTGGDAGHAIFIGATAVDTSVRNCTLRNTGTGGAGTPSGLDGRAVQDLQTTAANFSMIYSNFAHNIANSVKYNIQNTGVESGVLTPNPPTSTVINPLANVYAS